ncbi:reverse transcriptase family protein [Methylobacterium nodulans]|uniref:RNA-directed DNA polymerase n=1 Tax=Methylobacterium nodulans (strain LMG 21967 / CNCM I-2342 / ORS 2060) TaxID=460265 RepID=B8IJL2_METNO|nr:reverse transcriptase family protein [Methylobacterium nodulans]ACL58060.1 RNA-directed DNA polymerase (Reverse transcriptase) [Methylobacterium nodulans ORS 2060]
MTAQPGALTRQQLYDRIRETSKDEVILEEMIRLGFWPQGETQPSPPEELIRRRGEIARELAALHTAEARWRDPEAALKEMHKRRKKAALERRKETKRRGAEQRHARALAWHERRAEELVFLGDGVSAGLRADAAAPPAPRPGLPVLATPKALADAIGIPLAELRFLAYDRALSRISHYWRFTIPKKAGGVRLISAPMPRLKRAQYWILDNLLAHAPVHDAAHGFVPGRSIVTNAAAHVGRAVVVNLDLKDFFPTLSFRRVKGKFRGLGYAEPVATVLALLCTEPDVDEVEIDGERLFAARGPRRLPQGAPTSPLFTNLICARLDARLSGLARSMGFTYTRYADDLTFSGAAAEKIGALIGLVGEIVAAEGFVVHPDKTRIMRRGSRQEVTGLTVNERVAVPRDVLRRFRALLHQIEATGPAGKSWGQTRDVMAAARGFACFVRMVTPEAGEPLVATVRRLGERHGLTGTAPAPAAFRAKAAAGEPPLARWWIPAAPPAPEPEAVLREPAPPQPAKPMRSALDLASLRADLRDRAAPPAGPAQDPGEPAMKPWVAVIGVLVLWSAASAINPALGTIVLIAAIVIATRWLIRRWRRRRRR